jgi:acetoacetate decarboxylase
MSTEARAVSLANEDIALKDAWSGPAALSLSPHALAAGRRTGGPRGVSAVHILVDLTLGLGKVVYDYLPERDARVAARQSG